MMPLLLLLIIAALGSLFLASQNKLTELWRRDKTVAHRVLSARRVARGSFLADVSGVLTNERLTDQKSQTVPESEYFALAANVTILKGQMVGLNGAGLAQPVTTAGTVTVLGAAGFSVSNATPPTGYLKNADGLTGLAGQGSVRVQYGVNKWNNATGAGAATAANVGQPCWQSDDQTVSMLESAGLPCGIVCGVGDEKGGGDAQVQVLQGPHGVALAVALIATQGDTSSPPNRARAVVTTLDAYTGSGTATLTETTASSGLGAQDGVTLVAGDIVFIQAGTANLTAAKDSGPWVVSNLGSASVQWVLTRPSWFQQGAVIPIAYVVDIGGEGTMWGGTAWKSFATKGSAVIGTNDPAFYVGRITQKITLAASTFALCAASAQATNVGIRSATETGIDCSSSVGGTPIAGTVGYGPIAAATPGYIGTSVVTIDALASGMAKNGTTDTSQVLVTIINW